MDFTREDLTLFEKKGITKQQIEEQIRHFINGFPFASLDSPATPNDGIRIFSKQETDRYIDFFDQNLGERRIVKFVPASGAATRMFKDLFSFLENLTDDTRKNQEILEKDKSFNSVYSFINNLKSFAFINKLEGILKSRGKSLDELLKKKDYRTIIEMVLSEKGLNYGALPKGLLHFHQYDDHSRLAIEEHMVEGAFYARNHNNTVYIHFTVSPEHLDAFRKQSEELKRKYEKEFGIKYFIDFSTQKDSTDTIAVDMENQPFRDKHGNIIFRPGGHGALIENLNSIEADLIFIKNIDNIVPDRLKPDTYRYKKLIAGYLLELQKKVFDYLERIDQGLLNEYDILEIQEFMEKELMIHFPDDFKDLELEKQFNYLQTKLNRPIRICGMVKNEGEPGGGPFWVINDRGEKSLQIVEKSQIDTGNETQDHILQSSTHFNPVDIVCATKDFKGNLFNLKSFIDQNTGFISIKSKDGKDLKALELPGLWNGAMADWNTIFVEVPVITFNPVKTINDLLREQHQ